MRARWLLLLCCTVSAPVPAALFKHVDGAGNVTYSDRPQHSEAQALELPPPNVATPEARRQLELARQAWEREERAEQEARLRRWAAAQRTAPRSATTLSRPTTPYPYRGYGTALPYYVGYARSPAQDHPSQGLRPAPVPHRPGPPRR
jgi:hypothetical protein